MRALKQYAKHLKRVKAFQEICADLKPEVLRELKRIEGGDAIVDGVEFHRTKKVTVRYAKDIKDILDDLKKQIDQQKKLAKESGKMTEKGTPTFDAEIPKAHKEETLREVPEYARHFGKS